ncbi:hypothetical protein DY245_15075 [Streptomyces inhibens]|uniref:Uncharacterized protein n=1 Tax=Streptomyces inhibens TaxID=2293571 RepID=A0A371Q4F9_STRIH|nr:hypothetical protein DY245_15075 [Streptomyces inhibens]
MTHCAPSRSRTEGFSTASGTALDEPAACRPVRSPTKRAGPAWGHRGLFVGTIGCLLLRDDGVAVAALGNSRSASDCSASEFTNLLNESPRPSRRGTSGRYDLFACY